MRTGVTKMTRRQVRVADRRRGLWGRRWPLVAGAAALLLAGGAGWLLLGQQTPPPMPPPAVIDGTPVPVEEVPAPREGLVLDTTTGEIIDIATGETVDPDQVDAEDSTAEPVTLRPGEIVQAPPAVVPEELAVVQVGDDAWLVIDPAQPLSEEQVTLVAAHVRGIVEQATKDAPEPDLARLSAIEEQQSALAGTGLSLVAVFPAEGGYTGWTGLVDDTGHVYDGAGVSTGTAQEALEALHQWLTDHGVAQDARIVINAD